MSFICVCPEKSLQLGDDEVLHRANQEQFVETFLEAAQLGGPQARKMSVTLPGGGVAVDAVGSRLKLAQEGQLLAVLQGSIQNYAYLVKKYLQGDLGLPANVTLEAIKERNPVSEPSLLCRLYSSLGTGMLSKLRGHFSFCVYDSTTVRVLAARDPSGSVPLYHGHLTNSALFVSSSSCIPADANADDVLEIQPGHYKYGWRAAPRKYSNPETVVKSSAAVASRAALAALTGIAKKSPMPQPAAPRRASFDVTRVERKPCEENRRQSMDTHKINSRADEQGWWRSKEDSCILEESPATELHGDVEAIKKNILHYKEPQNAVLLKNGITPNRVPVPKDSIIADNFINQLGGAFLEDSASVRMLRSLLCCSPCSLIVTDALDKDKPIVFVNSSFEEQTGYTSAEVLGKNCRFLQAAPSADRVPTLASRTISNALGTGCSSSTRILNYRKDGFAIWNELSIVPLRNASGTVTHHVGMQTFSNAADINSPKEAAEDFVLESKKNGIMRSRSCSDMMMAGGQLASTATSLAF